MHHTGAATGGVSDIYVAKQPIVDTRDRVYAHELLYRSSMENRCSATDADHSSAVLMANALQVTGCMAQGAQDRVFVNLPRNTLLREDYLAMPVGRTVFELLEDVEPDSEVADGVRRLKAHGYEFALDDYVGDRGYETLLGLADYVKVDFLLTSPSTRRSIVQYLTPYGVRLLAEKVETEDEIDEAKRLGFSLFQGFYYARPKVIQGQSLNVGASARLRLLKLVNQAELDYDEIENAIKTDLAVAHRLLKYINCMAHGAPARLNSIKHALAMLGENVVRKWVSLTVFSSGEAGGDHPMVSTCIARARFCESMADEFPQHIGPMHLFLFGLLSGLDAVFSAPLDELLVGIELPAEVRVGLLGGRNELAGMLDTVVRLERAEWDSADTTCADAGFDAAKVRHRWRDAIGWSSEITRLAA